MHRLLICAALGSLIPSVALAVKPFPQVEDGYPEPPGQIELDQTFTLDHPTAEDHGFTQFSAEHELEFGVSENFYIDSKDEQGTHFDAAGVEAQYYFTNPHTDPIGISIIGAASGGDVP